MAVCLNAVLAVITLHQLRWIYSCHFLNVLITVLETKSSIHKLWHFISEAFAYICTIYYIIPLSAEPNIYFIASLYMPFLQCLSTVFFTVLYISEQLETIFNKISYLKHTLLRLKMLFLEKSNVKILTRQHLPTGLKFLHVVLSEKKKKHACLHKPQPKEVHRTTIKTVKQSVQ